MALAKMELSKWSAAGRALHLHGTGGPALLARYRLEMPQREMRHCALSGLTTALHQSLFLLSVLSSSSFSNVPSAQAGIVVVNRQCRLAVRWMGGQQLVTMSVSQLCAKHLHLFVTLDY